ncbi:MAG: xylene monooxygenase [SAR324 cluster bacterium]|uniref:Xylene monooxygenase n=1 Tax=SAR324 cluster bacterium TaxID=2024889 RepID=A0A7X9FRB5_9DELT|nr:xylene monooxygenase [SAR324 cluster bacterium]
MRKYVCDVCGFVYDPEKGIPEIGIAPGTPFEELPEDFECPICGVGKSSFSASESGSAKPFAQTSATLVDIIQRTPSIKSFRFQVADLLEFKAGQYLKLSLGANEDLSRFLSISNSPTERSFIEVTKRISTSTFSLLLDQAQKGLEVEISYPMGNFIFEGDFKKIALISGGIGITPLRSICRYIVDTNLDTDICLLYANRSREEIAFKNDFDEMQNLYSKLKALYVLDNADESWQGLRGRIDASLIQREIPDYLERCCFVCGPPLMVKAISECLLNDLKVPKNQVRHEDFVGY